MTWRLMRHQHLPENLCQPAFESAPLTLSRLQTRPLVGFLGVLLNDAACLQSARQQTHKCWRQASLLWRVMLVPCTISHDKRFLQYSMI